MSKVVIRQFGVCDRRNSVEINGFELPLVRGYAVESRVGEVPVVTVQVLATEGIEVEIRDALPEIEVERADTHVEQGVELADVTTLRDIFRRFERVDGVRGPSHDSAPSG